MLLPHLLLILLLEEVVAGDGQSGHQHNKLVKIHLVVLVGIQVVHDFLHQHRIFLGLQRGERKHFILCLPTNEKHGTQGADATVWTWTYGEEHAAAVLLLQLNIDPEAAESSLMLLLNEP